MPRLLGCPHCQAMFTLAQWAETAGCPSCGRRVSFFEASEAAGPAEQGAPPGVPVEQGAPPGVPVEQGAPPASLAPGEATPSPPVPGRATPVSSRRECTLMGKPLRWTLGWKVVVGIWVLAAVALVLARTQMAYLTDYSIEERAAVAAVPVARMPDRETTFREAMAVVSDRAGLSEDLERSGQWYVWSRPWEDRVYVWLEYGLDDSQRLVLGWWVAGGEVTADPRTERFLESALDDDARLEDPGLPEFLRQSL